MTERRRPPRPVTERQPAIEPTPTGRPGRVVRRQALEVVPDAERPAAVGRRSKRPPTLPRASGSGTSLTMIRGSGDQPDDPTPRDRRSEERSSSSSRSSDQARRDTSRSDRDRRSAVAGRTHDDGGAHDDGSADAPTGRRGIPLRLFAIAGAIVIVAIAFLTIAQPMRQWREQRQEIGDGQQRLDAIERQRERTREQTEELGSDETVRRTARELFEMVDPGEDLVVVLPPPSEDLGLPNTWPFTGVERELGLG